LSSRKRGAARGTLIALEALAAVITIAVVAIGLINHFDSGQVATTPGEGKRIVAFRQVTNRICTEHRGNVHRALAEANNRVERLSFLARAIGWDVNDLESITPPPTRSSDFLEEVAVRQRAATQVLALQQAVELHRLGEKARAIAALEGLELKSIELSRGAGIVRCLQILPPIDQLLNG
jgi:hypothetical protein